MAEDTVCQRWNLELNLDSGREAPYKLRIAEGPGEEGVSESLDLGGLSF